MTVMKNITPSRTRRLARLVTNLWLVLILVLLTAAIASQQPQLLDGGNLTTILRAFSIMVVMVMGLTWVMAAGQIDVSFMQVAALANMTSAGLLAEGWGWEGAMIASLCIGLLAGFINGGLGAVMRLPDLIVTISMAGICASAAAVRRAES